MKTFIILFTLLVSFNTKAHEAEAEVRLLFQRYDELMAGEKIAHSEVFTKSFLTEFEAVGLNYKKEKSDFRLLIREGVKDKNLLFVKRIGSDDNSSTHTTFILIKENGQWRLQGTLSDDL